MNPRLAIAIAAAIPFACSGCVRDQTRLMTQTCVSVLEQDDPDMRVRFLRDAEVQLQRLRDPPDPLSRLVRNALDPQAEALRPALQHCVAMLRQRGR